MVHVAEKKQETNPPSCVDTCAKEGSLKDWCIGRRLRPAVERQTGDVIFSQGGRTKVRKTAEDEDFAASWSICVLHQVDGEHKSRRLGEATL